MSKKPTETQPQALEEKDLDRAQGGVAPLKPAEFVTGKPRRSSLSYLPEVDDEVIV